MDERMDRGQTDRWMDRRMVEQMNEGLKGGRMKIDVYIIHCCSYRYVSN